MTEDLPVLDEEMILESLFTDPSLFQHQVRRKTAEGECIACYQRVGFAVGQQTAVLHLPIEPGLATVPEVSGMVLPEHLLVDTSSTGENAVARDVVSSARVKFTDCKPYGVRAEVSLPQPLAFGCEVLVEVIISTQTSPV